jgi:hypothetical protein
LRFCRQRAAGSLYEHRYHYNDRGERKSWQRYD